jgi:hypothetical protein
MSVVKTKGGNCGCSGGNMAGGSGYGLGVKSSPMLLGPYSGYGAIDPYRAETYDRPLTYPPLVSSMLGGKRSRARRSAARRGRKASSRRSAAHRSKSVSRKSRKVARKSRKVARRSKSAARRVKGGSLTFSDFAASAGVAPSGSQNISSSPYYSGDVSSLGSNMSALANPIPIKAGNSCSK